MKSIMHSSIVTLFALMSGFALAQNWYDTTNLSQYDGKQDFAGGGGTMFEIKNG